MIVEIENIQPGSRFLVLEGPNGCGKSSAVKTLVEYFEQKNLPVLQTFEPGGTPIGQKLRKIIFEHTGKGLDPVAEMYLFAADRAQHIRTKVKPALDQDTFVISDRYFFSTMAFQGYGRGLDLTLIEQTMLQAIDELLPGLVIFLDVDAETGLSRNKPSHDNEVDGFEEEEISFHNRVREGYLKIAKKTPVQSVIVDAHRDKETVSQQILKIAEKWTEINS